MSEPYVGEIRIFAGSYCPKEWVFCDGSLLPISGNEQLFSLLNNVYGGDGRTNFGLPDLRGRLPMHRGAGPGLTPRVLGQHLGQERVTIKLENLPAHNHPMQGSGQDGTEMKPSGNVLATTTVPSYDVSSDEPGKIKSFSPLAVESAGGSQSHHNMMPYMALQYIISLRGVYPPRQ